jgi:hypothetical protein
MQKRSPPSILLHLTQSCGISVRNSTGPHVACPVSSSTRSAACMKLIECDLFVPSHSILRLVETTVPVNFLNQWTTARDNFTDSEMSLPCVMRIPIVTMIIIRIFRDSMFPSSKLFELMNLDRFPWLTHMTGHQRRVPVSTSHIVNHATSPEIMLPNFLF